MLVRLCSKSSKLQHYVNQELPDVQAGFRKGRGTRDQIASIHWITENAWEFQKIIFLCFNFWAPKSLQMVIAAMKLKYAPQKKSYDQPRHHIKKQRHYFANKGPSSQSYGFPSS